MLPVRRPLQLAMSGSQLHASRAALHLLALARAQTCTYTSFECVHALTPYHPDLPLQERYGKYWARRNARDHLMTHAGGESG